MPDDVEELEQSRQRMLERDLRGRGIRSSRVLKAMQRVPRERFIAHGMQALAYADQALPIDCGQTISQPYMVALMTEALELTGIERVLEIGTGSGYQTALLAELAADVFTVERHPHLAEQAQQRLRALGYRNIHFHVGDGTLGWPDHAPYDRIIVTAAAYCCPPGLWHQLAEAGLLVGPFGREEGQMLQVHRRLGTGSEIKSLTPCRFVPLIAGGPSAD